MTTKTTIPEKAKRYIVTHNILAEHPTWADAEAERQRLKEKYKHNNLTVYCVLHEFQNYEDIKL